MHSSLLRSLSALVALLVLSPIALAQTNFTLRNLNSSAPLNLLWSFASGGGTLVTVGQPGIILSSTDGLAWTRRNSGTTDWLVAVAYGNGQFVIVGENGRVLRSPDGVTWTPATGVGTTTRLNGVLYAAGRWVAAGESGVIFTSNDANTWTPAASPVSNRWLHGIAYGSGTYCIVGQSGTILTSPDARTWTQRNSTTTRNLEVVTYVNSYFCAVGEAGECVFGYGPGGGATWYNYPSYKPQTTANLRSVASVNGTILAVGDDGVAHSTPNFCNIWTRRPTGATGEFLNAVAFAQDTFFLLGQGERILESEAIYQGRLGNLSTRGTTGTGAGTLISGVVVRGTAAKRMLIRAAGPALTPFGVTGALAQPVLSLFDASGALVATNTGWGTAANAAQIQAAQSAGGFPFAIGSADSALLLSLNPGTYTAQVSGAAGTSGVTLIETYDLDNPATMQSRMVNLSSRGTVGVGQNIIIPGVNINGTSARLLLVRAVGPSLAQFGVAGTIANPQIIVTRVQGSTAVTAATNDDWNTQNSSTVFSAADVRDYTGRAAAFALAEGSRDAALLLSTATNVNYTIQVLGVNGDTGVALVEVYDVTDL